MTLTILATDPNADLYGASRMMLESVAAFREADWRVTVTVPSSGPLQGAVEALGAEFRVCPMPVLRKGDLSPAGLVRLAWRTLCAVPSGVRLVRSVRPDVVYVNTITQPLWLVIAFIARVPVVCHVHEGESTAAPLLRKALALPLVLADHLVVNSQFSARVLVDALPRLRARCTVVYNGVTGPPVVTGPRAVIDPPVRLLYLGRLSERKGVLDAIDAVVELDARGVRAELDVVGSVYPGYEWVEDELRARRAAGGLEDRVRLHGFDPDVWPHLAAADVLLVPSRADEPFGNTAVEGALAARPVVASATTGLLEATEGMRAGARVPPRDPPALAEAVVQLLDRWPEVGAQALDDAVLAADRFAPERYRATLRSVVEDVHT